jgi:hypothetical protein
LELNSFSLTLRSTGPARKAAQRRLALR